MEKLGLPKHRYLVAILSGLYVAGAVLTYINNIFGEYFGNFWISAFINLAIGCLGIYALYKEEGYLMKIYGWILVIVVICQVLSTFGLFILFFLREELVNALLKSLMASYHKSVETKDPMDEIQRVFECCGRKSYRDWAVKPDSCCETSSCTSYYTNGCVDTLSLIALYVIIIDGILIIGSAILHVFTFKAAFELARVFREEKNQSSKVCFNNI